MKKSRIILPAIALLAVSGIASVTGTVAWFTASQSVTTTVDNVAAINTTGDLTLTLTAVSGCTKTANDTIKLGYLRDASLDVTGASAVAYTAHYEDGVIGSYDKITDISTAAYTTNVGGESVSVYYAAHWTGAFKIGGDSEMSNNLMFDVREAKSYLEAASSSIPTEANVYKALRIAMVGSKTIVWAPWAGTTATTTTVTYINSTDKAATKPTYTAITQKTSSQGFTDGDAAAATAVGCMKSGIKGGETETVQFYVWFEGSDEVNCLATADGVINAGSSASAVSEAVKAMKLAFYTVRA